LTGPPLPFPWAAAMQFGLGLLRLSPKEFWTMTPAELLALGGAPRPSAPSRREFEALRLGWPDTDPIRKGKGDEG
jgi:uncharacterized phage protein (TIGR02216 family)